MSWINVSIQSVNPIAQNPEGFLEWRLPKEEWKYFLRDVKCSYSPCHYTRDSEKGFYYRLDDNAVVGSVNSLMLDFDDGLSISEALKIFAMYDGIIATTKSHQKDKHGVVCDRFRVIIPTKEPIDLNKEQYSEMMSYVMEIYPQADKACKNISRFYFSNPEAEIYMLDGSESFDWREVYTKARKLKAIQKQKEAKCKQEQAQMRQPTIEFHSEKSDYIRSLFGSKKLLDLLKFDRFSAGGRNNYLYSVAMYLKDSGLSDSEVADTTLWVNAQGDGISEKEIRQTIFRSMRIAT